MTSPEILANARNVLLIMSLGSPTLADDIKTVTFDENVAAIFKRHCVQCHGESKQKAGLDLSSYASAIKGGTGGAVVVAGRASASPIVRAITAEDPAERMPPENDPLPADQVAAIKSWIDGGLRQNSGSTPAAASTGLTGFRPTPTTRPDGPPPMPGPLPPVARPKTLRAFPVLALAASPRASLVASASYEAVDLIDPASRNVLGTLPFPPGEVHVLRLSRSGATLLAAGGRPVQDGAAILFDVKSGRQLARIGEESDVILAADLSPDERLVAIGGSGRVVKVYSTEDGKLRQSLVKHTDWITSASFSPDGKLLATGDRVGAIQLWDAIGGGVVLPLAEHKGAIRSLAWRPDGQVLASVAEDGMIVWWDVDKGCPAITKADAHPPARAPGSFGRLANGVLDAAFGPKGELATCGRDGNVRLWGLDGRELQVYPIESVAPSQTRPNFPTRVAISADGSTLVAGDSAGRLHSWKVTPR